MKKPIFALVLVSTLFSCTTKECDNFHEGKKCENEVREKYTGTYYGEWIYIGFGSENVYVDIALNGSDSQDLTLTAAGGVNIKLTDSKKFTIPLQSYSANGVSGTVQGSGEFTLTSITLSGVDNSSSGTSQFSFFGTKQ